MTNLTLRLYDSHIGHEIPTEGKIDRRFRNPRYTLKFDTNTPLDLGILNAFNPEILNLFSPGSLNVGDLNLGPSDYWEFVRGGNQRVWYRPQGELNGFLSYITRKREDHPFTSLSSGNKVVLYEGDELAVQAVKRPQVDLFVILKVIELYPKPAKGLNRSE